jgi:hypothetical protein
MIFHIKRSFWFHDLTAQKIGGNQTKYSVVSYIDGPTALMVGESILMSRNILFIFIGITVNT